MKFCCFPNILSLSISQIFLFFTLGVTGNSFRGGDCWLCLFQSIFQIITSAIHLSPSLFLLIPSLCSTSHHWNSIHLLSLMSYKFLHDLACLLASSLTPQLFPGIPNSFMPLLSPAHPCDTCKLIHRLCYSSVPHCQHPTTPLSPSYLFVSEAKTA